MKHFFRKNWGIILAGAIYGGTFVLDSRVPLGIIVWIFYFIPILLDFPIPSWLLVRLSFLVTALTFFELFKGSALIPFHYALFNRTSGMMTLWLATWILLRRRSLEESRKQIELQRQATLQTLEAERTKLQATLDALPVGVWLADTTGRIVKTNEQAEAIWGPLPQSDSVADYAEYKGWWPDTGIRLRAGDWALARALLRGETIVGQEINIQRFDGGFATIMNNAAPIRDEKGRITGAVVVVQDITERKRVEAELKESEERCRAMVDAIPQLAWIARADGFIYWYNQGWYDYTGTKPEQMEGWGWQSVHDPRVLPEVLAKWRESIATGKTFEMVFPLKGADGRFRRFLTRVLPVKDAQGKVIQWFGTNTDVDELKRVEDALHKSREDFRRAQAVGKIGNWRLDLAHNELVWSEENYRIFGVKRGEPQTYETFMAAVHPQDREYVDRTWREALKGKDYDIEHRIVVDGTIKWVREKAYLEFDAHGTCTAGFGITQDITERKRVESQREAALNALRQSQEELKRALVSRSDFISRVSHELRTPLTAMSQGIDIVSRGVIGNINEQQQEMLELASRNAKRLKGLIDEVLDFQRLDAGKEQMVFEKNDLNKALREVCGTMRIVAEKKGLGLDLELKEDELRADFDYNKIVQVMNNLLNNALKFTDQGRIIVRARRLDGSLEVTVRDSGIGIRKEDLNKLFREFVQVGVNSQRKAGGTGLGLIISKKIVEAHGGVIWIESEYGKGTSVYFTLPVRKTSPVPSK